MATSEELERMVRCPEFSLDTHTLCRNGIPCLTEYGCRNEHRCTNIARQFSDDKRPPCLRENGGDDGNE